MGFPDKVDLGRSEMKRKRFRDEQSIAILNEHEGGMSVADLARRHEAAEGTLCTWTSKFGGMEASDAKRLRELEGANAKLKNCCGILQR